MTLDDVIKGLGCFTGQIECQECPYVAYHVMGNGIGPRCLDLLTKEAISYLLQYKSTLKQMEQVEQIRADAVRQRDAHIKAIKELNEAKVRFERMCENENAG